MHLKLCLIPLLIIAIKNSQSNAPSEEHHTLSAGGSLQGEDMEDTTASTEVTEQADDEPVGGGTSRWLRSFPEGTAAYWLWMSSIPLLILPGVVGHMLTMFALRQPALRTSPTSVFLMGLTVADLGYLFVALVEQAGPFLTERFPYFVLVTTAYCKTMMYLNRCFGAVSNVLLACMAGERALAISMPLKSKLFITRTNNKVTTFLVYFIIFALFIYLPAYEIGSKFKVCRALRQIPGFSLGARRTGNALIFQWLPTVVIILANTVIVTTVTRSKKQRKILEGHAAEATGKDAQSRSIVAMVLVVSVAFLICKTPINIWFVLKLPLKNTFDFATREEAMVRLGYAIIKWLVILNHSINFYLYVLSGSVMRRAIINMFSHQEKKNSSSTTSITSLSGGPIA